MKKYMQLIFMFIFCPSLCLHDDEKQILYTGEEEPFECFADNPEECLRVEDPVSCGCEAWLSCYDVCVIELGGKQCYEKCNIEFLGIQSCGCEVCTNSSESHCHCADF